MNQATYAPNHKSKRAMSIARMVGLPSVGNETKDVQISVNELVAESRLGSGLARALLEHVMRMHAEGYSDEVIKNGQRWTVVVQRETLPS